jgi:hypothetical protein
MWAREPVSRLKPPAPDSQEWRRAFMKHYQCKQLRGHVKGLQVNRRSVFYIPGLTYGEAENILTRFENHPVFPAVLQDQMDYPGPEWGICRGY